MRYSVNMILFREKDNSYKHIFISEDKKILAVSDSDCGIDFTVYDSRLNFSEVDGGILEYPYYGDKPDFKGYTIKELFDFVNSCNIDTFFDKNSVMLCRTKTESLWEKIDKINYKSFLLKKDVLFYV